MVVNERAAELLEEYSVHLPRWRRLDPLARLRAARSDEELLAVFAALGDRHTHCALPTRSVAWLPFAAGTCDRGILVTGSMVPEITTGDRIVAWNGRPIAAVVRDLMTQQLGANAFARRAKALQTLTFRPLAIMPAPRGDVTLSLASGRSVTLPWRIDRAQSFGASLGPAAAGLKPIGPAILARGRTIRVTTFHQRPDAFLRDFLEALDAAPRDGVIVDLRGCEEGIIQSAEQLPQLFSDDRIEPHRFRFRLTRGIRTIVERSLPSWRDAVRARGVYSAAQPITSPSEANAVGRRYRGRLVVLVDALTYSSAEMFAAGVQDHGLGTVIGTAPRTGGGGASAWSQAALAELTGDERLRPAGDTPSLRIAVRRAERVGRSAGRLIERRGVIPDVVHVPTAADLLEGWTDLYSIAERILAE